MGEKLNKTEQKPENGVPKMSCPDLISTKGSLVPNYIFKSKSEESHGGFVSVKSTPPSGPNPAGLPRRSQASIVPIYFQRFSLTMFVSQPRGGIFFIISGFN